MQHINHNDIPPVFDQRSRVLILGTIPSPKSREQGFYYAHPQNRFWRILAALFEQPLPETAADRRAFALEHRIALWDVLAVCDITGAQDNSIRNPVANDFSRVFNVAPIRKVFTTGKTATKLYHQLTGLQSSYLPSTSPANCRVTWEEMRCAYQAILPYLEGWHAMDSQCFR